MFTRSHAFGTRRWLLGTVGMVALLAALPGSAEAQVVNIAWGKKVTPAVKAKVIQVSGRLSVHPDYLMSVMALYTNETFSPAYTTGVGANTQVGLIGFTAQMAAALGTNQAALRAMSAVQQLDYVERYLRTYRPRMVTLEDTYLARFYPPGIGQAAGYVLFANGSAAYTLYAALDGNRDGRVTRAEAAAPVRAKLVKGRMAPNFG